MSVALRREIDKNTGIVSGATQPWEVRYGRRLLFSDALLVTSTVFGAQIVWVRVLSVMEGQPVPLRGAQPYASVYSIAIVLVWLGLLSLFASRDPRTVGTGSTEYRRVVQASLSTFGLLAIVVYLFDLQLARGYFLIALPIGLCALIVVRRLWRRWLCAQRESGEFSARVVLAGSATSVTHIARQLARMPEAGYHMLGVCVPAEQENAAELGEELTIIGAFDDLIGTIQRTGADTIVLTSSDELPPQRIRELSWQLEPGHQHLIVAPTLTDIGGPRILTRPVAGLPLIHVETPRYAGGKMQSKRLFDIGASAGLVIVLAPLLAAIAFAIRLSSPGPVLFRQRRIGKNGRRFSMLKFRSMVPEAEAQLAGLRESADAGNDVLFKMRDDPRVTPLGRTLRRYSLDELPQLFNVLAGHMSLIGPRPPLPDEVEEYERHVHRRFLVKPGITGLWQVSGRSNLSWEESVRLDLYYVENWTLTGDLAILFRTARTVLGRDGAF
jgi:exopolysaccharide biosynthesis polyprenyl glycosylphosphotransferase